MKRQLHILARTPDEMESRLIAEMQKESGIQVVLADLTVAEPDYTSLVEQIFSADAVFSW